MSKIRLHGTSSGYVEIAPAAAASNNTLTAPSTVGEIIAKDAAGAIGITSMKASNVNVGAAVTITESGIEASGIGITCANINGTQIGGRRNLIINGAMQVAQRGTSQTSITTSGFHTVDRFAISLSALGTWTQTQDTTVPTAKGFTKSLKMDVTTADSSPAVGDFCAIQYKIEAQDLQLLKYGTSSAETVTLKFHVRSPKTGTHIVHIYQNDGTRHISKAYTISSADTYQEVTINIEGDTGGTINNDNGIGLQVEFFLGAGTNFTSGTLATSWAGYTQANSAVGQVNCADNTANNFFITGVQLEVGSQATPFEHRSYGDELALCMRYYEGVYMSDGTALMKSYLAYGGSANFEYQFKVQKRAIPTWSLEGNAAWSGATPNAFESQGAAVFQDNGGTLFTLGDASGDLCGSFDAEL